MTTLATAWASRSGQLRRTPRRSAGGFGAPRTLSTRTKVALVVGNLALFCLLWEVIPRIFDIKPLFLPPFSDVMRQLGQMHTEGVLLNSVAISGPIFVVSMLISLAIAVPLGIVIGGTPILDRMISPYVWAVYTMPRIVLLPLVLLWFGIGDTVRVVMVVISAVPPIMVVVMDGIRTVDPGAMRAARAFGASRSAIFRKVMLPSVVPFVATGTRFGVARGLGGLFLAEVFTARSGVGFVMLDASRQFNTPRVFAILLVFIGLALVCVGLSYQLERYASRWRPTVGKR